ncbi:MAG TPA: PTS N-acetyl-D-glucosamine transporter, partial [Sphingomonas sp.]|nr:PTS N-acetyl-D-glucosamine transporter [Sphingomonas sp.]
VAALGGADNIGQVTRKPGRIRIALRDAVDVEPVTAPGVRGIVRVAPRVIHLLVDDAALT